MPTHDYDENSAPSQTDTARPSDGGAHLAGGVPGSQPPVEQRGADVGRRHTTAAGTYAIYETAHFTMREMGAGRGLKTLLTMNQKDGFDCPSCAWPDPDGDRHIAEFCENGAKAAASEATTKRLTPTCSIPPHPDDAETAGCGSALSNHAPDGSAARGGYAGDLLRMPSRRSAQAPRARLMKRAYTSGRTRATGRIHTTSSRDSSAPTICRLFEHVPRVERRRPHRSDCV